MPYGLKFEYETIEQLAEALEDTYEIEASRIFVKYNNQDPAEVSFRTLFCGKNPDSYLPIEEFNEISPENIYHITSIHLLKSNIPRNKLENDKNKPYFESNLFSSPIAEGDPEIGYRSLLGDSVYSVLDLMYFIEGIDKNAKLKDKNNHAGDDPAKADIEYRNEFSEKLKTTTDKRRSDRVIKEHSRLGLKNI